MVGIVQKNVLKFSSVELKKKIFFQRFQLNFIVLPILNVGARRNSIVSSTPWPPFSRERASTHFIGGYCDSRSVWTERRISSYSEVGTQDGPARN